MEPTDALKSFLCQNCFHTFSEFRFPVQATDCAHRICEPCLALVAADFGCQVLGCPGRLVAESARSRQPNLLLRFDRFSESIPMPKCLTHFTRKRLICLDGNCRKERAFCCNNCMSELHKACSKRHEFDVERVVANCRLAFEGTRSRLAELERLAAGSKEFAFEGLEGLRRQLEQEWRRLYEVDFREPLGEAVVLRLQESTVAIASPRLSKAAECLQEVNRCLAANALGPNSPIHAAVAKLNETLGTLVSFQKVVAPHLTVTDPATQELKSCFCCLCGSNQFKNLATLNEILSALHEVQGDRPVDVKFQFNPLSKELIVCTKTPSAKASKRAGQTGSEKETSEPRLPKRQGKKVGKLRLKPSSNSKSSKKTLSQQPPAFIQEMPEELGSSVFGRQQSLENSLLLKGLFSRPVDVVPVWSVPAAQFSMEGFYERCRNRPQTLLVVHTENEGIVGGFSDVEWRSGGATGAFRASDKAFLFNLANGKKYPIRPESAEYAVYCGLKTGLAFGDGADLSVSFLKDQWQVFSDLMAYKPEECTVPGKELLGKKKRLVERIELFEVRNRG